MMKQKIGFLLLFLLFTLSVSAQSAKTENFSIKGQVIDSLSNESVPYATLSIALTSNPQKPVKLLACNEDGKFESTLSTSGNYILSIQSIGKAPTTKAFAVTENNKNLNMGKVMMSENNERLGEVTVTAQKPLVKVDIDKITYNLDEDPEAKTSNSLEMLRKVPMVTVDGEDKIQLKGSENFKIYMNGKPSSMLSSGNASDVLRNMPASSIKNIEVITDPGAKYDAEGIGGIINIITVKNALEGYTGTIRTDVSALGRYGAGGNLSLKAGKFGLSGNYNYRQNKNPWNDNGHYRESKKDGVLDEIHSQDGRRKMSAPFQFGSLEASYEIDSLNLLTLGANMFRGKPEHTAETNSITRFPSNPNKNYSYNRYTNETFTFGSLDLNIDYQHSTKKKDEMLTVSYKFSNSPSNRENKVTFADLVNYADSLARPYWEKNDAYTNEHTAQFDYTTPTRKDQSVETGVKYILRDNNSDNKTYVNSGADQWLGPIKENFSHTQHIYAGYLGYSIKHNKFGYKAGVRAEGSALKVKYAAGRGENFDSNIFDIVPNATVSYQLNMAQQLRLGYNLRIQRPGIRYLNPFVNNSDPKNISYGNPNLDSEKSHNINANYSMFNPKFNINLSANYSFVNNVIEEIIEINNGVLARTYDNIGKRQQIGTHFYARWNPVSFFNITMNAGGNYTKFDAPDLGITKDGLSGNFHVGPEFTLPKDFRISLYGGAGSPWLKLQGEWGGYHYYGVNINKSFLQKKLNVGLNFYSPFEKTRQFYDLTETKDVYARGYMNWTARDLRLTVSYTFGNLKGAVKKARRGIVNDDVKSDNNGGQGGGQGS